MKVNIDRRGNDEGKKVRIETKKIILDITECRATGRIVISKVDGDKKSALTVFPRYSNEIDIE